MVILDGKACADELQNTYKDIVGDMKKLNQNVTLAVIQVGEDKSSSVYVRNKEKACEKIGINSLIYKLDKNTCEETLISLIESLNIDNNINGILVQLPLPIHINKERIMNCIDPRKDVDGFHKENVGKLMLGNPDFVPCTTSGITYLLQKNGITISGKNCVIVGRSDIVGKPTAMELLRNDATVTICHSKTEGLKDICKNADILVAAIGKPKFFDSTYVKPGATVIDVGIHRLSDGSLCGDVDFNDVKDIVSAITPVPKGVGAMTVAMLLNNCIIAAKEQYARGVKNE